MAVLAWPLLKNQACRALEDEGPARALGFTVKGEVCGCDLVALRGEEPPIVVIGELKLAFSLELQGVDRTAACGEVWLAVRVAGRGGPSPARPTLSAPPSRPTVTPNDTRRKVSARSRNAGDRS